MDQFANFTEDQLRAAARRAFDAGDKDAARRLMEFAQQRSAQPPRERSQPNPDGTYGQPPEDMFVNPNTGQYTSRELLANAPSSRAEAAQTGAMRGLSFGGGDEALGAINAIIPGQGTMGQRYQFGREMTRAREEAGRRDFPAYSTGAEVGGGVATALTYGLPAIAQRGLPGAMVAGGAVGGAEGTGYGFLTGEGGFKERARNAAPAGLLGMAAGALSPVVMAGAARTGRGLLDAAGSGVDALIQRGSTSRADRALANTFGASGLSLGEVETALTAAQRAGQPEFVLADALGTAGQRRLSGIVRSGGDASDDVAASLIRRQTGQGERIAGFIEDAFDASRSAADTQAWLRNARKEAADIAYSAARRDAGPVDVRSVLSMIDDRIGPMQGSGVTGDGIDAALAGFRRRLAAEASSLPEGTTSRELSDFNRVLGVKQDIQDAAQSAYRQNQNNRGSVLDAVWRELDSALEAASPTYRAANDNFREMSRVIDSVQAGQEMARSGARSVDNAARFGGMSADQQAAARTGYGDALLRRVEGQAGPATNRARPLTSDKIAGDVRTMAMNPDQFQMQIARENIMHDTMSRSLGGSRTADNLADISAASASDMGALVRALSGDLSGAARQAVARFGNAFTGMNKGTRKILADALMSNDTQSLRRALAQAQSAQERNQIVTAMLRIHAIQSGADGSASGRDQPLGLLSE